MDFVTWIKRTSTGLRAAIGLAQHEAAPLTALVILAGGTVAFIDIAEDVAEGEGRAFDEGVLKWLHPNAAAPSDAIGPPWLDRAMADLTSLGSLAVLSVMVIIAVGYLLFEKKRMQAALLALALLGGLGISEGMKHIFERTRPPDIYHMAGTLNASFPSGHALLATVAYLTLGAMLAQGMKRRRLKAWVIGWAVGLAMIVGVSRIYLGVHWTTDVLAGWALGGAWSMACWLGGRWLVRRLAPKEARKGDGDSPA